MATSTCIGCGGHQFHITPARTFPGSEFKMALFQCATCGGVLSVLDFWPNDSLKDDIAKSRAAQAQDVKRLERQVAQLAQELDTVKRTLKR